MKQFSGVFTALVTPFIKGELDYQSLKSLIKFQLDNGVQGFVVNGTTGESPTLTVEEQERVFQTVKAEVDGQVPLVLGTGTNSTRVTVDRTIQAGAMGADAALVVVPYYNKPTQVGLVEHFRVTAEKSRIPVIAYNVPGRTITSIELSTFKTPTIRKTPVRAGPQFFSEFPPWPLSAASAFQRCGSRPSFGARPLPGWGSTPHKGYPPKSCTFCNPAKLQRLPDGLDPPGLKTLGVKY